MSKKQKFTAKDKKYILGASEEVHAIVVDIQRLALRKLKHRTPRETYAIFGRIVMLLVSQHFGLTMQSAMRGQEKHEAAALAAFGTEDKNGA